MNMMRKAAAQPPAGGDPMAMGGMPPGGDPMAMGAMPPPGMDPMAAGMPPGAMPPPGMDPMAMGGMPPAADPMAMGAMPPVPPAADPAAAAGGAPKSGKAQKEEFMNNIQTCLDDIKDYTYNNLMILIRIANALNIQIPAETLVSPPDGKNMDILTDPAAISAAAAGAGPMGAAMAPEPPASPSGGPGGPSPEDLPPADQAPSEVKMSMYNMLGVPSPHSKSANIKKAMHYLMNQNKTNASNQIAQWLQNK